MTEETTGGRPLPENSDIISSQGDLGNLQETHPPKASPSSISDNNEKEKDVPHYLRASGPSCHDFCKYGKRHTSELKGKRRSFLHPSVSENQSAGPLKEKLKHQGRSYKGVSEESSSSQGEIKTTMHDGAPETVPEGHPIIDSKSDLLDLPPAKRSSTQLKPKILPKVPSLNRASSSGKDDIRRGERNGPASKRPTPSIRLKNLLSKGTHLPEKPSVLERVQGLKKPFASPEPTALQKHSSLKIVKGNTEIEDGSSTRLPLNRKSSLRIGASSVSPGEKRRSALRSGFTLRKTDYSSIKNNIGKKDGSSSGLPINRKSKPGTDLLLALGVKKKSTLRLGSSLLQRAGSSIEVNTGKEDGFSSETSINRKSMAGIGISSSVGEKKKSNMQSGSMSLVIATSSLKGKIEKRGISSCVQPTNRESVTGIDNSLSKGEKKRSNLQLGSILLKRAASSIKVMIGEEDRSSSELPKKRKSTGRIGADSMSASEKKKSSMQLRSVPLEKIKYSPPGPLKGDPRQRVIPVVGSRSARGKVVEPSLPAKERKGVTASVKRDKKVVSRGNPKVNSELKALSASRLTFRAGKVFYPHQSDVDLPRRLKFKQAKRFSSSLSERERQSFKRKESSQGQSSSHPCLENLKVVLKHREVNDKKESQILLNEVIELTANKLAETSKSKVKALVGAFETVISLQESRPAAAAPA